MSCYGTITGLHAYGVKPAAYPSDITEEIKLDHLTRASSIIDSYLRKRHTLPISSYGDDLSSAAYAIATYTLIRRRGADATSNFADQLVVKGYDDTIRWLENLAKGLVELAGTSDATPAEPEAAPLFESDEPSRWTFANRASRDGVI